MRRKMAFACVLAVLCALAIVVLRRDIPVDVKVEPAPDSAQPQYKVKVKYRERDPNQPVLPTNVDWAAEKCALMAQDHLVEPWREAARAMIRACPPDSDTGRLMEVLDSMRTISELEITTPIIITPMGVQGLPSGCSLIAMLPSQGHFAGSRNFHRPDSEGIGMGEFNADANIVLLNPRGDLGRLSRASTLVHELYHVYEHRYGLGRTGSPASALQSEMYAAYAAWQGLQAVSHSGYHRRHMALIDQVQRSRRQPSAQDMVDLERDFGTEWRDDRAAGRQIMHGTYSHSADQFGSFEQRSPLDNLIIFTNRHEAASSYKIDFGNLTQVVMVQALAHRQQAQNEFARGDIAAASAAFTRAKDMDPVYKSVVQMRAEHCLSQIRQVGEAIDPMLVQRLDQLSLRWVDGELYNYDAHQMRIAFLGMCGAYDEVAKSITWARQTFPGQVQTWDRLQNFLNTQRQQPQPR